ncbi:MAG: hypothetical protein NVS9B4_12520 [Candidatus Acidiferrum sp.]
MQNLDAKFAGGSPSTAPSSSPSGPVSSNLPSNNSPASSAPLGSLPPAANSRSAGSAPSADTLYSNGLRDITSGKYDLARSEFQDYLKYYGDTDLASNAQFYLGEIAYQQRNYAQAVSEYDRVITNYPKSFKLASARLKKGMALIEVGQKASGIRDLREVVRRFPGTEEERRARARLKELGAPVSAVPDASR